MSIVESQKDYHIKREQLFTTPAPTLPTTRMSTTEMKTTTSTFTIGQMTYMAYTEASFQTREHSNTEYMAIPLPMPTNITVPTTATSTSTTVATTNMPSTYPLLTSFFICISKISIGPLYYVCIFRILRVPKASAIQSVHSRRENEKSKWSWQKSQMLLITFLLISMVYFTPKISCRCTTKMK